MSFFPDTTLTLPVSEEHKALLKQKQEQYRTRLKEGIPKIRAAHGNEQISDEALPFLDRGAATLACSIDIIDWLFDHNELKPEERVQLPAYAKAFRYGKQQDMVTPLANALETVNTYATNLEKLKVSLRPKE